MADYDGSDTWDFVMRETDRAEIAAREQLLREKAEKERIASVAREAMRKKEDELHAVLYREMKKQREKELRDIINNDTTMKAENGENRVSQWHAHRDNKMRLAGEAFKKQQRPATLAEERALLGFGTKFTTAEMMEKNNITAAHIWGHDSDQLVGKPGTMYKPPGEEVVGSDAGGSEAPADGAAVKSSSKPQSITNNSILQYPSRDPKEWGAGMNLRYSDHPSRSNSGNSAQSEPADPPTDPTPDEVHAGKLSSTVSPSLRVSHLHSNKTDPVPPSYAVPAVDESDKTKEVSQPHNTHSILKDWNRASLGTKKTVQKPTTTQLLRQHYARVLTSSKLPSKEVVDSCAAMSRFQDDVWSRRHDASLLEKLLKRNTSNPEGGVLHGMMDQQQTFPALDAAIASTPKILIVKAPDQFGVSGDYFLCETGVFTYWENPSEMLKICIHNGAWAIGKTYLDVENEAEENSLIKSQGNVYELPHQVKVWRYRDDVNSEWKETETDITVTEKTDQQQDSGETVNEEANAVSPDQDQDQDGEVQPDIVGAALSSGEWIARKDPRTGRQYFVNSTTKKSVWDLHKELTGNPAPIEHQGEGSSSSPPSSSSAASDVAAAPPRPPLSEAAKEALRSGAWLEKTDPRSGKPYYCNTKTKKSYWNIELAIAENP